MNFKEIQLVGFKSFADKTAIKFDDGVTCIVGPNGCGKSNVADAVRWVLGEQSAKTLRGTSMQDVIFNGTESRRALSYCEVTLVFDNSTRLFDIDYEEVAMTRRLYRSGESEYLLNKQTCRLRDIVALLHGVGIGKEGYSIIGQGKVEQIMNAKPEDRRAIFEEATGVMKFKTQKGEIERKLENASDNRAIFLQRIDEAEKQLHPLEKQAETARKYREFSTQLQYEEVNTYLVRSETFTAETDKHRAKIRQAEERLSEVELRLTELDMEERQSREKVTQADEALRSLNDKLRLFEVGLERKSGEAKVIDEQIRSYKTQCAHTVDDIDYSLRRTLEIDDLTAASQKKTAEGQKRAKEIEKECAILTGKLREADARFEAYERISSEKRASEISSVENLADVRANVGSLSAKSEATSERISEVRAAIEKAKLRETEFTRELEECSGQKRECEKFLDEEGAAQEQLAEEVTNLSRSRQKLTEDMVSCNTSIANLSHNLELYQDLKNRFDGYRDSVRKLQLTAKEKPEIGAKIKGAIADIVSTEAKYETAIETAFGGAMQNLVTATADDARDLIEYLKKTGGGIVTFLPVDAMRTRGESKEIMSALKETGALGLAEGLVKYDPYYENVIKNLLGNTLICDTIGNATSIAKKYSRAFKIVTLDGDTIATSGAMTGGSRRKESGNLLAGERRIKECELQIEQKRALLQKLKAALEACETELSEAKEAQEKYRIEVQQQTANFAALAQKQSTLSSLLADAQHDVAEYTALLERLSQQKSSLESEVLSSAENEDLLNKIRSEAAAEISARQAEAEKLKAERAALAENLQKLQLEGAAITSAREAEEQSVFRLQREKEHLRMKVEEGRKAIAVAEDEIQKLQRQEEEVLLTDDERKTVAALRERVERIHEEKRAEAERQVKFDDEKRTLLSCQYTLSEEKHASEIEISKAETNLENMRQRIEEAYGLTQESAQEYRDQNYDISQSASNINSLKHRISALGNINMNAEEDYNNLLARHTEMLQQQEDIEKGISDLNSALEQLKTTMQKQFDEGFTAINQNFTRIFKELFGGGKAEMQLDYENCDDPLNAGVEIVACPPGKKLTKISLLSGGERAFTAIAILFAILKTRPMPFCILDEIEAALDEANVGRFAKYLKKFSQDTQFVVITHRKPTMNQADTLFGVTMEEKGVSKIVSVKLSEVESRLGGDTVI